MLCPLCGRSAGDDDRFCGGCGAGLTHTCPRCRRRLADGAAFCTHCGAPRSRADATVTTEDRRPVSVLFVDLVEFTPYAEQADPELVRQLQHIFYTTVRRVVSQHGGVVEKYIGDAGMALFGAPVATETDALRCVRAGLELQRVFAADAPDRPGHLPLRVGIATGEALVDVAAARDGGQAIVAGDVVNTAARIESVAPAGGVLVCGRTYALTAGSIRYAPQAPVTLRGRSHPTEVWLALAPISQQHGDTEPDPTPLVEREHELALLRNTLRRAFRDRMPHLATIFGQAGIGKSRLVRELRECADQLAAGPDRPAGADGHGAGPAPAGRAVSWRIGHCPPFGENVTYAALADIVKAEAGILETDSVAGTQHRLRVAVRGVAPGPEADRLVDALGPLVGLPGVGLPPEDAESAWRRYLIALAARSPTVLVFEDLHWADESMLRFIELLAATARDVPLLVLATSRPELIDREGSWSGAIAGSLTITLPPLRNSGMLALYRHMLPEVEVTAEQLRPLVELADGNPLYAQEYARMVRQGGLDLPGAQPATNTLPVPDNVQAVIANRVDLLDTKDRAVLQAAAVVGVAFWPGAVAAALGGRPAGSVERSLRRLEQREFLAEQPESSMAGQSEFRFRHVLVRDVCYQRLPRIERVAQHERTADWLDAAWQRRDTDLVEVLAHHRWAAHQIARSLDIASPAQAHAARQALYLAGRRAYRLHALDIAADYTSRALTLVAAETIPRPGPALLRWVPPTPPADPDPGPRRLERFATELELFALEIAFYQDRGGFLAGDGPGRLQALANRLAGPARAPELAGTAARAWTLLGQVAWLRAEHSEALESLGWAVTLFAPLPDSPEKVDAYTERARLHMLNYECEPAIAAAATAVAIAERLGLAEAQANARITMATARYEAGDPAGLVELQQVTDECRRLRLLVLRRATRNLAHLVREEGDWRRSEELLAESVQLDGPGAPKVAIDNENTEGLVMRAYFTGDLHRLIAITTEDRTAWQEERGLRGFVRALRADPGAIEDAEAGLATARSSGFYRPLWGELATAALCRALRGERAEAADLLAELTGEWEKMSVIASGEWVTKAGHAAALAGPEPAAALAEQLADLSYRTRWAQAALHTVTGAVAQAGGDPAEGGRQYLTAAEIHAHIPALTDRALALALAAAALQEAGDPDQAAPVLAEVHEFAQRNHAPVLLRVAERGPPGAAGPPVPLSPARRSCHDYPSGDRDHDGDR